MSHTHDCDVIQGQGAHPEWAQPPAILAGAKAFYRTQCEVHDDLDMPDWKHADYNEACAAIRVAILVISAAHGYHWPDTSEGTINELLGWGTEIPT